MSIPRSLAFPRIEGGGGEETLSFLSFPSPLSLLQPMSPPPSSFLLSCAVLWEEVAEEEEEGVKLIWHPLKGDREGGEKRGGEGREGVATF